VDEAQSAAIERRIEYLILGLGAGIAIGSAFGWGLRAGAGAAIGTALCWLNFRWLRQGAMALMQLGLAQAGAETVRVPRRVHAKFLGRLVLLLLVVYAILVWLRLPVIPFLCGLVAVVPAVIVELLYELLRGLHRSSAV
jgi:ATP synthase I chain